MYADKEPLDPREMTTPNAIMTMVEPKISLDWKKV